MISASGAVFFSLKIYLDDHESRDEADDDSDEQLATYNKLVLAINYVQRLAMDCGICFEFEILNYDLLVKEWATPEQE